jgi:hypothetical protein
LEPSEPDGVETSCQCGKGPPAPALTRGENGPTLANVDMPSSGLFLLRAGRDKLSRQSRQWERLAMAARLPGSAIVLLEAGQLEVVDRVILVILAMLT